MFKLPLIRGGVHPDTYKDTTAQRPIMTALPLPPRLFLPLRQHAGAEARALVKAGDRVLKGQPVATTGAEVSACLHAPTSGKVKAIEAITAPHPSGLKVPAIVIEADGEERWAEPATGADPFSLPPPALADRVEAAGVVGLGGAIFPSAVKLRQSRRFEIKTLLVNGGECEPYLTTDDRLMRERAAEIVDGARLVQYITEARRVVIGIEDNKPEAIAAMRRASAAFGAIEVVTVPTLYPMGSAKQLIQAVTGQEVPAGGRSNDLGILVHNAATLYAIQQALRHGRPLISRVLTVAGACVARPQNVEAPMGTPINHILAACGGLTRTPTRLLMGGPMMGQVLPSVEVPLIKGGSGVLALDAREVNAREPAPCIRCGRCVEACPMGLVPLEMASRARADDFDGAGEYGLRDCILCGSCSYVCPSHIPLVQYFEYARGALSEQRANRHKLDYTKRLTAARSARMEREAAAKAAAKSRKRRSRPGAASSSKARAKAPTDTKTTPATEATAVLATNTTPNATTEPPAGATANTATDPAANTTSHTATEPSADTASNTATEAATDATSYTSTEAATDTTIVPATLKREGGRG